MIPEDILNKDQKIFNFNDFNDRIQVEMKNLKLLGCNCGQCKGVPVKILNESDLTWEKLKDEKFVELLDEERDYDVISFLVNIESADFHIKEEVIAYCWKVYIFLFEAKKERAKDVITNYKCFNPEYVIDNFTNISNKNLKMLISHICDPELSKQIYAFTENDNQDLLIFFR